FIRDAEKNAPAFLRRSGRPRALFKCSLGSSDGAVDIVGRGVRNLGDDLFGRGIVDGKSLRRLARDPFAVDKHLVCLHVGFDSAGHKPSTNRLVWGRAPSPVHAERSSAVFSLSVELRSTGQPRAAVPTPTL